MARELKMMIATKTITLRCCPCCGADPAISVRDPENGSVTIRCSKNGCAVVMGQGLEDAAAIWNRGRFTDPGCSPAWTNNGLRK